jgi:hypothetical protein
MAMLPRLGRFDPPGRGSLPSDPPESGLDGSEPGRVAPPGRFPMLPTLPPPMPGDGRVEGRTPGDEGRCAGSVLGRPPGRVPAMFPVPGRVAPGRVGGFGPLGRARPPVEGRFTEPGFIIGFLLMLDIDGRLAGRAVPPGRDMFGRETAGPRLPPVRPIDGRAPPPPIFGPPPFGPPFACSGASTVKATAQTRDVQVASNLRKERFIQTVLANK